MEEYRDDIKSKLHYMDEILHKISFMSQAAPEKIILWGGVMHQEKVFDMVRQNAVEFLNGYLPETSLPKDMSQYVVAPALGENPGIIGAMCLGMDAYLMECGKNL